MQQAFGQGNLCIMPLWQGHYSSVLLLVWKSGLVNWKCSRARCWPWASFFESNQWSYSFWIDIDFNGCYWLNQTRPSGFFRFPIEKQNLLFLFDFHVWFVPRQTPNKKSTLKRYQKTLSKGSKPLPMYKSRQKGPFKPFVKKRPRLFDNVHGDLLTRPCQVSLLPTFLKKTFCQGIQRNLSFMALASSFVTLLVSSPLLISLMMETCFVLPILPASTMSWSLAPGAMFSCPKFQASLPWSRLASCKEAWTQMLPHFCLGCLPFSNGEAAAAGRLEPIAPLRWSSFCHVRLPGLGGLQPLVRSGTGWNHLAKVCVCVNAFCSWRYVFSMCMYSYLHTDGLTSASLVKGKL